ncbi:MAG: hypothetical protein OHK0031_00500 [Anaerolineales bacterium]
MVTKTRITLGLLPKEKKAVREFIARVCAEHGDKIQHAALFGSKTREDWTESSDVDILLIVANNEREFRRSIIHLAAEIELKHDVILDVRVIPAERWNYYAQIKAGLYLNIHRDAVPLRLPKIKSIAA